jgi:hypothetical protein
MASLEDRVQAVEDTLVNGSDISATTVITTYDENLKHIAYDATANEIKQVPADLLSDHLGLGVNVPYVSEIIKKESTVSSNLYGGTETQPNLVGIQVYAQFHISDGRTVTYDVTAPFVINNLTRVNVRANIKRLSDGAIITYTEGSGFSVNSGYGTNTINVTLTTTPTSGDLVEFTVYGESEDPSANATLITTTGYDNLTNAIASFNSSHHGIIFTGNGHNTLLGGSFLRAWGSFNTAAGSGVWIGRNNNSTLGCFGFGRGLEIDGNGSATIGTNNKVNGTSSFWFGRDSNIDDKNDTVGFGRKGDAVFSSSLLLSGGRSSNTINGQHQFHKIVLNRETTDDSDQFMRDATGATSFALPNNSAYTVAVSIVALKDDYTKSQSFSGTYNLIKDDTGTTRFNGSTGDVVIASAGGYGSPAYSANVRGISGKLGIRVAGEAGENVRWTATLDITQVKY